MTTHDRSEPGSAPRFSRAERQAILRLSRCWAAADFSSAKGLLSDYDIAPPVFAWEPDAETLPDPSFGALRRIWESRAEGRPLPSAAFCRAEEFAREPGLLDSMMILDVMGRGPVLRYRHYGEKLRAHAGLSWEGRTTVELVRFSPHALIFASSYAAVAARGQALYSETVTSPLLSTVTWCRYILPYADEGGRIVSFACVNAPISGVPGRVSIAAGPGREGVGPGSSAAEARHVSEQNVRNLLACSPSALMVVAAASHRVYYGNEAFAAMLGYGDDEVRGRDPRSFFVDPEDYQKARALAEKGRACSDRQIMLVRKGGDSVCVSLSAQELVFDHNKTVAFWFWDLSRLKAEEEALRAAERQQREAVERLEAVRDRLWALANTDALTGCANRRQLDSILDYELRRRRRAELRLCVLLIDVDFFKLVNDRHGHAAGDELLKLLVERMESRRRESDTLARYGGEEFVMVLPDADEAGALVVAEALRAAVSEREFIIGEVPLRATISVGVAVWGEGFRSRDELLAAADRAMYRAKARGRNRIELEPGA